MSAINPILHNLAQVKDSRWLTLEVCREFQRDKCSRTAEECKFAHPPQHVEVNNGRVVCCFDSIKGKCQRREPPCKYLHPPQHLREQLLQNGRNNLIMRQIQMTALAQSMQPTLLPAAGAATAPAPQHILQTSSQPVLPLQYPLLPSVQAGATSPAAALTAYQNPTLYHPAYNSALFQAQNLAPTANIFANAEQTSANSPTPSVSSTPSTSATTTKTVIRTGSNVAEPATALDSGQGKKRPHEDDTPTVAVLNPAHSLLAPNIKRLAVDKSGVPSLPAYGPAHQLPTAIPVSMPASILPTSVFSQQQMAYIPAAYPHLTAGSFMPLTGHPGNIQRF